MEEKTFKDLERGDIIRNIASGTSYVVILCGSHVTAMSTIGVTNPTKWKLIRKSRPYSPKGKFGVIVIERAAEERWTYSVRPTLEEAEEDRHMLEARMLGARIEIYDWSDTGSSL